jgi:hypothetical protein
MNTIRKLVVYKEPVKLFYFIAFLIVVASGLSFFRSQATNKILISVFAFMMFMSQKDKFDTRIIPTIAFVTFIILVQSIMWSGSIFTSLTFMTFVILVPYFFLKKVGLNFPKYVTDVIFVYAVISLIFWALSNLSEPFHEWTSTLAERLGTDPQRENYEYHGKPEQFILYTYEKARVGLFLRNPGPFHEPGAFAVFLIYGLIFNTLISRRFISRRNIILSIALVTTFSSAGYLAFLLLVSFSVVVSNLSFIRKFIFFVFLIFASLYVYLQTDILSEKIESQFAAQTTEKLNTTTSGRFLGARKAIYVLSKYPLTGRGILARMKADISTEEDAAYGFMSLAARIGLIGTIFLFLFFYRGIKQYCLYYSFNPRFANFAFIAFLFVLFAQEFLSSMLFMMIFLAPLIYPKFGELKQKSIQLNSK